MWLLTIAMGILAALINLPINERPVVGRPCRPADGDGYGVTDGA